ncbi:hypothetical protein HDU76_008863, partial [Blyttiomyces sp. JEL0837]
MSPIPLKAIEPAPSKTLADSLGDLDTRETKESTTKTNNKNSQQEDGTLQSFLAKLKQSTWEFMNPTRTFATAHMNRRFETWRAEECRKRLRMSIIIYGVYDIITPWIDGQRILCTIIVKWDQTDSTPSLFVCGLLNNLFQTCLTLPLQLPYFLSLICFLALIVSVNLALTFAYTFGELLLIVVGTGAIGIFAIHMIEAESWKFFGLWEVSAAIGVTIGTIIDDRV